MSRVHVIQAFGKRNRYVVDGKEISMSKALRLSGRATPSPLKD